MSAHTLVPEQARSPELVLPQPTPADLATLTELDRSLDKKGTALDIGRTVITASDGVLVVDDCHGLYPRDGVVPVSYIEGQVSNVTIRGRQKNIIWSSGEAALREFVNFAAVHMVDNGTRKGGDPIIAYGMELYGQSRRYFANEKKKGVNVISFDSGREESVIEAIDKGADVLFTESVANTPGMPVFNLHSALRYMHGLDRPPLLGVDNTLALKTGVKITDLIRPDDPVIFVESGTKNLMNNSELLGITYSPNLVLMDELRKHKAHSGAVNSIGALASISAKLKLTLPGFHDRNLSVFNSTAKIAAGLEEAAAELGADADFTTTFPTSPKHPNYHYAKAITPVEADFISPVAFITANDLSENGAPDLVRRIAEHPAIKEQIGEGQIHLGQSFGMPKARLLYDRNAPNVRFAGGFHLADEDALAAAIKEAAADK